jgi:phosphopantothenoylcysteine decarboxylase/phosphopantothenoylcysteine decarboxylase/phosphopantothenate--cysteine ligase
MNQHIVLGVTGSIAAYKAADIARQLVKAGYRVHVILTNSAREFITPLTFQSLTKDKVHTDMFEQVDTPDIHHISLAKQADLLLLAPATANLIGKLANGIADDMLTTVAMAAWEKPTILCPAMNTAMYQNPLQQANLQKLKDLGYVIVEPKDAVLACGDKGKGALADVEDIVNQVKRMLEKTDGNNKD